MTARSRGWVWTINCRDIDDEAEFLAGAASWFDQQKTETTFTRHLKWWSWSLERGKEDQRLHLQGACYFAQPKSNQQLKRWTAQWAHLEVMKGTQHDAYKYTTKDDDTHIGGPWLIGEAPAEIGQGRRSDLDKVSEMILSGARMKEVALAYPSSYIRYHRGFQALQAISMEEPKKFRSDYHTIYIWGPPEIGKTRLALKLGQARNWFRQCEGQWSDGSDIPEVFLIDDLIVDQHSQKYLYALTDKQPGWRLFKKGVGAIPYVSELCIITSNFPPEDVFSWSAKEVAAQRPFAWRRRFDLVLGPKDVPPILDEMLKDEEISGEGEEKKWSWEEVESMYNFHRETEPVEEEVKAFEIFNRKV